VRLTLCGDIGRWYLRAFDLPPQYSDVFFSLIDCWAAMKSKNFEKQDDAQIEKSLIYAAAQCEVLLPVYWNTQVRHMMIERFIPTLRQWGSMWAIIMLVVECHHIQIKKCCRSRYAYLVACVCVCVCVCV
jgi:hypothetical protein